jgi:UDP-N-acetylglucosamine--dolichyl-phosphate N-acetylglucosaminephosphotransferase
MQYIILITLLISIIITYLITPYWIRRATKAGLIGKDKHKKNNVKIAEVGGLPVICGFLFAMLFYIAISVFIFQESDRVLINILAALLSISIATIIGVVDDILGWKIGLRKRYKIFLTIFIALPIMVINAGHSTMNFPIIGIIDLGLLYPLLIIPLGIMGSSNGFNMLAGYNGLEASQGIIMLSTLGLITYLNGSIYVSILAFSMVFSLIAFFYYNKFPSKIFPGDTLTYSVGALIGIVAILGNIEKFALIIFGLYYFELLLKARGGMKKESFARLNSDGTLSRPHNKYYGIEHIVIDVIKKFKKKVYEKDVVMMISFLQILLSIFTLIYFLI